MLIDIEHTKYIAKVLASKVRVGDVIALSGEVGVGKTTFAQIFIGALLKTPENITSPTFTLVQRYETIYGWQIMHADLYRLKGSEELMELGLEEYFETDVMLIEWPEVAAGILPEHTLYIRLEHHLDNQRNIAFSSHSARWDGILQEFTYGSAE